MGRRCSMVMMGVLTALCLTATPACKTVPRDDLPLKQGEVLVELSDAQTAELGAWVAATVAGTATEAPVFVRGGRGSAYVALRAGGKLLGESWGPDGNLERSLTEALAQAAKAGGTPDTVELDLAHTFASIAEPNERNLYKYASGKRVGIRGLELRHGEHYQRIPPTKMLAMGDRRFSDVVKRFFKQAGIDHEVFAQQGSARVFEAQQVLISLPSGAATKLLRGNVYVEARMVTQANTQATVDLMIDWMLTNLHEDGRMTYMWWPSQSKEKPNDNNMIRQWMATNALIKIAEKRDDPQLWARIAKNIDYNLEHFYSREGEFGLIKHKQGVKLGALSLAAMAIVNHPQRARWREQEHGLRRTVASMWYEDGSFDCFYPSKGRQDRNKNHQNFYPGETMLLWAQLYRESRDPELLRRIVASFRYYRDWHLEVDDEKRRRPSFVPWHTQADYILWETLRDPKPPATPPAAPPPPSAPPSAEGEGEGEGEGESEPPAVASTPEGWPVGTTPETPPNIEQQEIVEFVFEMNDWLIHWMEVWDNSEFDDEKGRFYSRKRDYGGAHASATGVYVEGLIDAYAMAKAVGDQTRENLYRRSLSRAIRSVMQIQFVDDIDMFYVTDRVRTKGGLRTTVVRNEVRVDNVQHVLMGVLKVLDRFAPEDYSTD